MKSNHSASKERRRALSDEITAQIDPKPMHLLKGAAEGRAGFPRMKAKFLYLADRVRERKSARRYI